MALSIIFKVMQISGLIVFFSNCSSIKKLDCRDHVDEKKAYIEIRDEIARLFPGYREVKVSKGALRYSNDGSMFFPGQFVSKLGHTYSVVAQYLPKNERCKKLSYQFVKLEKIKDLSD